MSPRGPSKHEWARHEATIVDLYINQGNTLKKVRETMEAQGFKASTQQYKIYFSKRGISKNRTGGGENRANGRDLDSPDRDPVTAVIPEQSSSQLQDISAIDAGNAGDVGDAPWDHNLNDSLDGNLDFDADLNMGADFNNLFNLHYPANDSMLLNIGIPQGQGVNAPSSALRTTSTKVRQPIHQAAQSGYVAMVQLLLEKQPACAGLSGTDGVTAIGLASEQGHLEIVELLLNYDGVDVNAAVKESLRTPMHQAAQGGHTEVVRKLLSHNAAANPVDRDNITPLWSAAQQGYHEIVQILIEAGADKEASSTDGARRPIHQAAQNGHLEVVRMLLDAGAKVDPHKDNYDDETPSPLWVAAQQGHCEIAKLLIRHKADVNFSLHPSKRFPIHQAAQNGHVDMVGLLVQNGADVNAREVDDWPPIMIAAQQNYAEIVDILIGKGANVNAEEKDGANALWIASQQGHKHVIKKLLEHEAKSCAVKSSQRLPIHQAAQNGHFEAVKLLVELCPDDVHAEEKKGVTALLLASQGETAGHLEVARYLLENGAEVVT